MPTARAFDAPGGVMSLARRTGAELGRRAIIGTLGTFIFLNQLDPGIGWRVA
jgi:hypothetical protein